MRHDMAPVTGGITNREKYRFVLMPRFGKGVFAPGIPVHRIVRVLEKVRGLLVREPVRVARDARMDPRDYKRRLMPPSTLTRQIESGRALHAALNR